MIREREKANLVQRQSHLTVGDTLLRERTVIEHCDWSAKLILAPSLVGEFNNRTD